MTEVTRVPLKPVAKGSLAKIWIGVILAALLGVGIAWAAVPASTSVDTVTAGTGPAPSDGDVVFVEYTGKLTDGTVFDKNEGQAAPIQGVFPDGVPFVLEEGAAIPGFLKGLKQTRTGGEYVLNIPADEAYGDEPPPGSSIPAGADLVFEVKVVEFMSRQDFERRLQALQQVMAAQQGGEGAEGGPATGAPPPPPQN
ncbi:FKBP-type peptidyl-prolyl cis-trans isomerase [Qipengyuania sp. DSG2-2]|uniref:FKBP-type peptidyl-prolyl cis-trans isomerase n=1 Tax=Qipengyuania sp. DGS2-2 TaxID=3349631 RepID=UPI0036D34886